MGPEGRRVTLSGNISRLAAVVRAILVILVLIFGCAPALIKMEKEELLRLKHEGEIRAVHYPPESPFVTADDPEVPWIARVASPRMSQQVRSSLDDPALRVKERFISALETALDLKNVRVIQEPLVNDDLEQLRIAFGKGLLLDVKTINWIIGYHILYSARSRLVRLEDSKILWQWVCDHRSGRIGSYEASLLQGELNEAADTCVKQLVAQFLVEEKVE